ncbi:MAG: Glu/Leu/Phe/Val dehydrogenase dimerization domain-containing protein [Bacteroidia bacterium]
MLERLKRFEHKRPEITFHWQDSETEAQGWVVINSLRNGAAGGGTRMRKGCTLTEVLALAKTMEVKFSVCGPPIGGAKSGIDFDPEDPRKPGVLKRWFEAIYPLLKAYYGTGGDLNVDEVHEVIPFTYDLGVHHPQEGIVNGHLQASGRQRNQVLRQLREGVSKRVTHWDYAPTTDEKIITVSDMITGYGVAQAVMHAYQLWDIPGRRRVIVQGFGNVGGAAALTLAKEGYTIIGIIDVRGGAIDPEGLSLETIKRLYLSRQGNRLTHGNLIPFEEANRQIWSCGAEVFIPAAASRIVTREQVDRMVAGGLRLISCGANVPFADPDIFLGPTGLYADERVAIVPDFIANCGMARTFAYLMQPGISLEDQDIFGDVSAVIYQALHALRAQVPQATGWWQAALDQVLSRLLNDA